MFNSYIIKVIQRNTELVKIIMALYERNFEITREKKTVVDRLQIYLNKYGEITTDELEHAGH